MIVIKKLRIITYPHPVLTQKANLIDDINDEIRSIADRMFALMKQMKGIGLAAPQIGLPIAMFVVDLPQIGKRVFVNPVVTSPYGGKEIDVEGCLSIPGMVCDVRRPRIVTLSGVDQNGIETSIAAGGIVARCFQHEYDHLQGITILDRCIGKPRRVRLH